MDLPKVHGKWYLWVKVVDYVGNEIILMDPQEYIVDIENPVLTGFDIMQDANDRYLRSVVDEHGNVIGEEIVAIASFSEVIHYVLDGYNGENQI